MTTLNDLKSKLSSSALGVVGGVIAELIEQTYKAGFDAGGVAMRDSILRAARAEPLAEAAEVDAQPVEDDAVTGLPPELPEVVKPKGKRAPKGLTESVLREVLTANPRLEMAAIQAWAVGIDPRISAKTVYNELYRKTDIYVRDVDGTWSLRAVPLQLAEGGM